MVTCYWYSVVGSAAIALPSLVGLKARFAAVRFAYSQRLELWLPGYGLIRHGLCQCGLAGYCIDLAGYWSVEYHILQHKRQQEA